jgi:hypothetical protein
MGRHAVAKSSTPSGARRGGIRGWRLVSAVVALAGLTAGTILVLRPHSADSHQPPSAAPATAKANCPARLKVVTATAFEPVLRQAVAQVSTGADCVDVQLSVADGDKAAAVVAASGADAWIPDEQSWPQLPNTLKLAGGAGDIVATSPLYFVTQRTAAPLPAAARSWAGLAGTMADAGQRTFMLSDPAARGDGMVAAGSLALAASKANGPLVSALDLMRAWHTGAISTALGAALPKTAEQVAVVPEYALLGTGRATDYTAVAPTDGTALLRFCWLPIAKSGSLSGDARSRALKRLRAALTGGSAVAARTAVGLRGPSWPLTELPAASEAGLPKVTATPMPVIPEHFMYHVLSTWDPALRRTNMLVLIDVSGSMAERAPGTHDAKIDVVRQGLVQLDTLLPASSRLGLWEFGAQLAAPRDWRVLVPSGPLTDAQRRSITSGGAALRALTTGTALYSSVLDAYRYMQAHFEAGIPNQLVVFTDGIDQDAPGSISRAQLQSGLSALAGGKHVQLSVFGFGVSRTARSLAAALAPVNGQVDQLTTAEQVLGAFVHAVSGGLSG